MVLPILLEYLELEAIPTEYIVEKKIRRNMWEISITFTKFYLRVEGASK